MANLDEYPAFWCDAMFGGLARWLRAAGYDAAWVEGIDDADLIRRVLAGGRILLTADTRLMEHGAVRSGRIRAILVPRDRDKVEQLRFVMRTLGVERREPRCMACGGRLAPIPKEAARPEVPAHPCMVRYLLPVHAVRESVLGRDPLAPNRRQTGLALSISLLFRIVTLFCALPSDFCSGRLWLMSGFRVADKISERLPGTAPRRDGARGIRGDLA